MDELAQKFICIIYIIRNNNDAIWVHISPQRSIIFRFFCKILVIVLFRIQLHGIAQNFAYNILILEDDIYIVFEGISL